MTRGEFYSKPLTPEDEGKREKMLDILKNEITIERWMIP
jgi:hypothetical protein